MDRKVPNKPDITLVFPSSPFLINEKVFPPLGILYLSAYLKQHGLKVQCLDMALHKPKMAEADTIGISITTPQRMEAYELARRYKRQGKILIAGGPHATHMPDECKENGFDYVLQGEAERSLLHLLITANELRPVTDFEGIPSLSSSNIPFPDRDALPIKEYKYEINGKPATVLITSRGCPYACSFCANSNKGFRMQSAERTVAEILHINERYGFEAFMIFDDVFISDKKRLAVIADALIHGFSFRCFGRSNLIDPETCELLKQLGVVEVGLGIESGSDEILSKNLKGTTRDMNLRAVELLHAHGIRAKAFLIVGLPGETISTIGETASWIEKARPDDVDISIFQPLPGSAIFADPKKWGVKFSYDGTPQWFKGQPDRYSCNVSTKYLSAAQLMAHRNLMEHAYKNKELLR